MQRRDTGRRNMTESSFMHGWVVLLGSLAMIALVLTAFGIMLGTVKPADAVKHAGAFLGIVIVLMLIPGILVNAWSGMSLWQQIGLVSIGVGIVLWRRPRPRSRERQ